MKDPAQRLRLIALDVDGTLTTGHLFIGPEGERLKAFHARDGMGIVLARRAGLKVGIITGRKSPITQRRSEELQMDFCAQGAADKVTALAQVLEEFGCTWEEAGFMGDDSNDLGVLARVGMAAAPADGTAEARELADFVATKEGGRGAVREWLEYILRRQGVWDELQEVFRNPQG